MHEYTLIIVPRLVTFTSEHGTSKTEQSDPGWCLGGDPGVWILLPFRKKSGPSKFRYTYTLLKWDADKCPMTILCIFLVSVNLFIMFITCIIVYLLDIYLHNVYTHNSW